MSSRAVVPADDPIRPGAGVPVVIEYDGRRVEGRQGQTIAGILLADGVNAWRTTARGQRPRGVFCGIGVCFDCVVTVDGRRDVRACLTRPAGGEVVTSQHDPRTGD